MSNKTLVDYYQGAYGPTLIVLLKNFEERSKLLRVFQGLAEGTMDEVKFGQIEFLDLQGAKDVILRVTSEPLAKTSLRRISSESPEVEFLWSQPRERWKRCVGLLEGLVHPGHQYLTTEGVDEALVEVSFMEGLKPSSFERVQD